MNDHPTPLVPVLAVVGIGLIGGSFAAALRRVGQVGRVLGVGRRPASLQRARDLGLIDEIADFYQAAEQADLILLATPVGAMPAALQALAPLLRPQTLITDAGSTKSDVARMARDLLGDQCSQFIPGHPIAGSEMTGPEAADPMLYHGRKVVLTPFEETPGTALHRLIRIWEACGGRVQIMDPAAHDRALASVSHVPHFLAAAYMAQVVQAADADVRLSLAGTGFRDFTRIAAGSAEVWRDIFLSNREAVLRELDDFDRVLQTLRATLEADTDPAGLEALLEQAALARRFWGGRDTMS
ncbi:MAG: prephenate dehydrogenase/arogenate dehydrogenase family protein [Castellaniella sp.]|uniref:prephenate dehydrogenase n=1 Tax=Castellaniella sp. TaxID=1955812 RepID=UPI0012229724|nr:prephenate dehydrogenase/arogenate dehydrogenase family protein [Castellaniella sp.]TAN30931.1 MAG: prephenate dehydrogenase/arogenate dehydrogenase family protein [Castellaniella sp.]